MTQAACVEGKLMADTEEFRSLLEQQQKRALAEAEDEASAAKPVAGEGAADIVASHFLDAHTKSLLESVINARDPKQTGYSNADLADELLKTEHVKAGGADLSNMQRGVIQRLALVSRLFGSVDSDVNLSAGFKQGFAALRFPLIKSALADPGFFMMRSHPLRVLAGELMQKASEVRLNGKHGERHLEELLQNASRDFDLSAAFVRPALAKLTPLPAETIDQFLKQLGEELKEREANRQRRARDVVGKAIQSRVLTTRLPQLVQFLIHEEWSAVLAKRLLEKGPDSEAWRDGLDCLDDLIEQVPAAEAGHALPDELLQRIEAGIREAGRAKGSGLSIMRGLRQLTAWMQTRAPGEQPPAIPALDDVLDRAMIAPDGGAKTGTRESRSESKLAPPGMSMIDDSELIEPPSIEDLPAEEEPAAEEEPVIEEAVEPPPPPPPPPPPRPVAKPAAKPAPPPKPAAPPPPPPPAARAAPPAAPKPAPAPPPKPAVAPRPAPPPPIAAPPPPPPPPPPRSAPAAEAPPSAASFGNVLDLLGAILRAGRWFRVYEHTTQKMRWVKLDAYYPAQNSIVFAEFDGASPLGIRADQFVKDLQQGLSSPTNPDAHTRALLSQLMKAG